MKQFCKVLSCIALFLFGILHLWLDRVSNFRPFEFSGRDPWFDWMLDHSLLSVVFGVMFWMAAFGFGKHVTLNSK